VRVVLGQRIVINGQPVRPWDVGPEFDEAVVRKVSEDALRLIVGLVGRMEPSAARFH